MRQIKLVFAIVGLAFCIGCSTLGVAKMESSVRKDYKVTVDRVYVLLATSSSGSNAFLKELKPLVEQRMKEKKVDCLAHYFDNLNLDEKEIIKNEIKLFKPKHILLCTQTTVLTQNGRETGATFDFTLQEPESDSLIWKATMRTEWGFSIGVPNSVGSPEITADSIVAQLTNDGLIKSTN
jgi:hypothetical protein